MTNDYNSKKISSVDGNFLKDMLVRAKLISRLMSDNRVNGLIKFLPVASLAYLVFPFDFIPGMVAPFIGAADDIAVMWFGLTLFLELCPAEVVDEHLAQLTGRITPTADGDIVDGEVIDLD